MPLRAFVSHSHLDASWCDAFVNHLVTYGVDIWYDRQGLYAGAEWVRTIEEELTRRDLFLVVLTPESWASRWVREELALALAANKRIVGVVMKDTQVSGFIVGRQMINVVGKDSEAAALTVAESLGISVQPHESTHAGAPGDTPATLQSRTAEDPPSVTGTWSERGLVPWVLRITQQGDTVTGAARVWGPLGSDDKVTGTVRNGQATLTWGVVTRKFYVLEDRLVEASTLAPVMVLWRKSKTVS